MRPVNSIILGLVAATALLSLGRAQAARSTDACTGFVDHAPAVISQAGTWCLRRDLATSLADGSAITIAADGVTLDCHDFKLGNLAAGPANRARGVRADTRRSSTVRNCNLRGFLIGLQLSGAMALVENNRLDGQTFGGIYVASPGGLVRDNRVLATGAGSADGARFGILLESGASALDNVVDGVAVPAGIDYAAFGILVDASPYALLARNRITRVHGGGAASTAIGISDSHRTLVRGNSVGNAPTPGAGVLCGWPSNAVRGTHVMGFGTPIQGCALGSDNVTSTQ